MFGKVLSHPVTITAVLLGFCAYIIRLFIEQKIILYIHPRYSAFALVMCSAAAIILLFGLYLELKKGKRLWTLKAIRPSGKVVNVIVIATLGLALILPAQTLSSDAVGRRSLKTPTYDTTSVRESYNYQQCPDVESINLALQAWVVLLSQYPMHCFEGKSIKLIGFVHESPDNPLPNDTYYLGRVVMSCCAIDAQPYALPVKKQEGIDYAKDTWFLVSGTLVKASVNGSTRLVVSPEHTKQLEDPKNPYEYIEGPSITPLKPAESMTQ